MRPALIVISLASVSFFSSCVVAGEAKLPLGRCNVNTDCGEGEACRDTRCEDIYFPEKNIKPD